MKLWAKSMEKSTAVVNDQAFKAASVVGVEEEGARLGPPVKGVDNLLTEVGEGPRIVIINGRSQEAVDQGTDQHGPFDLYSRRLSDLQTDFIQLVHLVRDQHHHDLFGLAL
jgi:hypothetical protein